MAARPPGWPVFKNQIRCLRCAALINTSADYDSHFTPSSNCAKGPNGGPSIAEELLKLAGPQALVPANVLWQGKTYQRGACKWCKREKQILSEETTAKVGQATVLAIPAGVCRLCVSTIGTTIDGIASKLTAAHAGGTPK